jgi:hypothetical protein
MSWELEAWINLKEIPVDQIRMVSDTEHYLHFIIRRYPSMEPDKYIIAVNTWSAGFPEDLTRDELEERLF